MNLDHLLSERVQFFKKNFNYQQRVRICDCVKFEQYFESFELFSTGEKFDKVYYILSGQVQMTCKDSNGADTSKYLNSGSIIHSDDFKQPWQTEAFNCATATCVTDLELLVFNRRDYWNIVHHLDTVSEIAGKVSLLKSISVFTGEGESQLQQLSEKMVFCYFPKNFEIVSQHDTNKHIYFVVDGSVRIDKSVPFLSKLNKIVRYVN